MNIYVGNLAPNVTEEDLKNFFAEYDGISGVKIIKDITTGSSKGFGFLDISVQSVGLKAVNELNGKDLNGKKVVVNEARPKTNGGGGSGAGSRSSFKKPYGGSKW
jgi:RNA recognition motif-containing protein